MTPQVSCPQPERFCSPPPKKSPPTRLLITPLTGRKKRIRHALNPLKGLSGMDSKFTDNLTWTYWFRK